MNNQAEQNFNRLEFLGDAVIEVLAIHIARKIFIKLKMNYCPEMLHSVKVMLLSTEGLSRIFVHLKLHRYLLTGGIPEAYIEAMFNFMEEYDSNTQYKSLWWNSTVHVSLLCLILAPKDHG